MKRKRELNKNINKQKEELKEMRIQKEFAEKQVVSLNKELEEADKEVRKAREESRKNLNVLQNGGDLREELLKRDCVIEDLERAKRENEKEIAGLKKLNNIVEVTMQENKNLKEELRQVKIHNSEVKDKLKGLEDNMKSTSRRLSKSCEAEMDLNDTVSNEMFKENSSESPPFHGFASESGENRSGEQNRKSILKRVHSSPGSIEVPKKKNSSRHPSIGSKIIVDTANEQGVFMVHSKKDPSETDFMYCLVKDGKSVTLNLKRVKWNMIDGGEKIPAKSTV